MIVIGLLLLIVAAAFGIDLVWKNSFHIPNPTIFGEKLGIHSAASLFVLGVVTGAAVLLGVALLLWGLQRKGVNALSRRHERVETRHLREGRTKVRPENTETHLPESEPSRSKKTNQNDGTEVHAVSASGGAPAD
jgi:hypothetical protein